MTLITGIVSITLVTGIVNITLVTGIVNTTLGAHKYRKYDTVTGIVNMTVAGIANITRDYRYRKYNGSQV